MPLKGIEVLVTDMDDTLLHPKTEVFPEASRDKLREWINLGKQWIIATGRRRDHTESVMDSFTVQPHFYITRSRYIYRGQSDHEPSLESWNHKIKQRVSDQLDYADTWIPIVKRWASSRNISFQDGEDHVMFDRAQDAERAYHQIKDDIDCNFKVLRNRTFLTVVPTETGKGNCLKYLCDELNWLEPEIACVGDGMNDANMLDDDYEFRSVVVSNAEEPLKQLVDETGGLVLNHKGGRAIETLINRIIET